MLCWNCDEQARATCVTCGRHVCHFCAKERPHLLLVWRGAMGAMMATATVHGIWCGRCEQTDPVFLPELDEAI